MDDHLVDLELFDRVHALAHLGVWVLDLRTGRIQWSDEMYRLFDVDPATEPTIEIVLDRIHPHDRPQVTDAIHRMEQGEEMRRLTHRLIGGGAVTWVTGRGTRKDGYLVGYVQDASEPWETQRRLEAALARSELSESLARLGSWEFDEETGRLSWSPPLYRLVGLDPATFEPTVDRVLDLVVPEHRSAALAFLEVTRRGGDAGKLELQLRRADGRIGWYEVRAKRVPKDAVVGVFQDVSDRRATADRLRLQAQILDAMNDCVVLLHPDDGRVLWSNPQAAKQLGVTVDELIGRNATEFTIPGQAEVDREIRRQVTEQGRWAGEIQRRKVDGTPFHTEARITKMQHPEHGDVWISVSHDIDDRKARERELHESELRLRAVQDYAPTGIGTIGPDGRWLYVNDALCTLMGRSREELTQLTVQELGHPDELDTGIALGQALLEGRATSTQSERRYLRPDGSVVWVLMTVSLVRDSDGEPRFFVAHLVDITHRKAEDELRRRQAIELERANRAKTDFLSRMSHELRTPLNAVLGFGQLLAGSDLTIEDHNAVEQILYAGKHLLGLINEVLDIARVESGTLDLQLEPVEVHDVVGEAVELMGPLAHERGVTLAVASDEPERFARGDRRRVVQVLLNLLSNAVKYNQRGGDVMVTTGTRNGWITIAVADSGRGIPAESMPRLFEPFERLEADSEAIEGTGIGLPLARGLIDQMGGTIDVESEVGVGSTFTVLLPAVTEPARPIDLRAQGPVAAKPSSDRRAGAVKVVHVEDNPANQRLIEATMRMRPEAELLTVDDATAGLELIRQHQPDLVVLDLHLPDIPGDEVLRQLRADPPAWAPIVAICSADASPAQIESLTQMGADHYLTKPIDIPTFLAVVDSAAARRAAATTSA